MLGSADVRLQITALNAGEGDKFIMSLAAGIQTGLPKLGFSGNPIADRGASIMLVQNESFFHLAATFAARRNRNHNGTVRNRSS